MQSYEQILVAELGTMLRIAESMAKGRERDESDVIRELRLKTLKDRQRIVNDLVEKIEAGG